MCRTIRELCNLRYDYQNQFMYATSGIETLAFPLYPAIAPNVEVPGRNT
jgi:hypothetical protein